MSSKTVALVSETELEKLGVVANCRMNRGRGLRSYVRELALDPLDFLSGFEQPRWLDICCGEGRALVEAAMLAPEAQIEGIDLAGHFRSADTQVEFHKTSLRLLVPGKPYHLITCVHGLHYIGDKLGALSLLSGWLAAGGRFVGHFDPGSVKWEDGRSAAKTTLGRLREAGWSFDSRRRLLSGEIQLAEPFEFIGADPRAGPNFTGQDAVDAYYRRRQSSRTVE